MWKYDDRGRLKEVHRQLDATHWASRAYFYDARGFVKEEEVGTLAGDPWSATASDLTWLEHRVLVHNHDAEGRRVRTEETDPGTGATTVKRLVYWGARLAATFVEGATWAEVRTHGYVGGTDGEAFVEVSASGAADGSYELARDFQGSVLALIDRASGQVVERYHDTPFGEVTIEDDQGNALSESAFADDRFFLGRPYDALVGIYDLRARWYDPEPGSFLAPDPLGPVDSWNLCQYGFATPATWMDPWGLQSGNGGSGPLAYIDSVVRKASGEAGDRWLARIRQRLDELPSLTVEWANLDGDAVCLSSQLISINRRLGNLIYIVRGRERVNARASVLLLGALIHELVHAADLADDPGHFSYEPGEESPFEFIGDYIDGEWKASLQEALAMADLALDVRLEDDAEITSKPHRVAEAIVRGVRDSLRGTQSFAQSIGGSEARRIEGDGRTLGEKVMAIVVATLLRVSR